MTKNLRLAILIRDGFKCVYCGKDMRDSPPDTVTVDHVVPIAQGGMTATNNLVAACMACNGDKDSTELERWCRGDREVIRRVHKAIYAPVNMALARALCVREIGPPTLIRVPDFEHEVWGDYVLDGEAVQNGA